jgi:hypothetical protein
MGLKTNISNDEASLDLRQKLMDAVGTADCTDEQVLHELTAALACGAVFSEVWTKEETLEAVAILYDVSEEVRDLKLLNPFVSMEPVDTAEA